MSEVRVEELVKLSLAHTDRKLKLIPEPTMEEALEQFVDKQQPQAIGDAVNGEARASEPSSPSRPTALGVIGCKSVCLSVCLSRQ